MSYAPAPAPVPVAAPVAPVAPMYPTFGLPSVVGDTFGYAYQQAHGLTQPTIHSEGLLGIVDRVWLTVVRLNTLFFLATVLLTVLSAILVTFSGKKEAFVEGMVGVKNEAISSILSKVAQYIPRA